MGVEVVGPGDDDCEDVYRKDVAKTQISQSLFLERNFRTPVEEIRESKWQESHFSSGKERDVTVLFEEYILDVDVGIVAAPASFVEGVDEEIGAGKDKARKGLCSFRPSLCSSTTPSGDLHVLQHGNECVSGVSLPI